MEQESQLIPTAQPVSNGFHPDMSDDELLTELSRETIQPSYGYVRLKFTHGEKETHRKLKIQPIDVMHLAQTIEDMAPEIKQIVLEGTAHARSVGFTEETWLQSLAACLYALCPPLTLTDPESGNVVWRAGGEPRHLPEAMIAFTQLGFDFWHVEEITRAVATLTRDPRQAAPEGNS